ncbi:MAG: Rrf2 family transcriptional regulator [Planctomycetes bacterium]|nr:Rrf2 family transcriptional regulator [Planctomycetota bacterium]
MLKLTKRSDYGIIALVHLARNHGDSVSCRDIASRFCIPLPLLSNILKTLARHGVVESVRGSKGGYRLAMPPEDLTLAKLLEILEGPIRLTECMELPQGVGSDCKIEPLCPIRAPVRKIHERFRTWLQGVTFAELAGEVGEARNGGHQVYEVAPIHGQPIHHPG